MAHSETRKSRPFRPKLDMLEGRISPSPIGPIVHDPTLKPIYLDPPLPPPPPVTAQ